MSINPPPSKPDDRLRGQVGLTLIELVAFIVIVGIGLLGILSVLNLTLRAGSDPLLQKQGLAIAESLLEEIEQKPFTYCDPDDANVSTATSAALGAGPNFCATQVENMGPENLETRYSSTSPFDNVNDYQGFSMLSPPGILNPYDGVTPIAGLERYSASVAITQVGTAFGLTLDAALRIDVTVTANGMTPIVLTGYRFRYAPN